MNLLALAAVSPAHAPPVVAMTADQTLDVITAAWCSRGEEPLQRTSRRDLFGIGACTDGGLCVRLSGSAGDGARDHADRILGDARELCPSPPRLIKASLRGWPSAPPSPAEMPAALCCG